MNPPASAPAAAASHHQQQVEAASPISSRPPSDEFIHQSSAAGATDDDTVPDRGVLVSGNRWPRQETLALLKIRSEMDATFRDATLKGPLWEHVSRKLGEIGYKRSAKKCKEKFENVHKYYKRTKDGGATRHHPKTYKFFSELEALQATSAAVSPPPQNPIPVTSPPPSSNPIHVPGGATSFSTNSTSTSPTSPGEEDYGGGRKRKNGGLGSMMEFFEEQMKQVLQRQEAMQQRFLEAVEKREQERTIREEAWKRQETARLAREHDLMAHERAISASRDAAVISFIQKVTGQTIPFPHQSTTPTVPTVPPPASQQVAMERQVCITEGRWPKAEVLALINVRSGLEGRYKEVGPKGQLWEEVSAAMGRMGYKRSSKRCKEKWENINKYFKKVKESSKKRPEDAKTCPYFHQLDALYRKKTLNQNIESPENNNGAAATDLFGESTKKPEDIVKENMMEQQQLMVDGYDMINDQGGEDEEEEEEEDEDEDEDEDDEERNKMEYKIEFQRPVVQTTAPSNGEGNESHSFFAMVQ